MDSFLSIKNLSKTFGGLTAVNKLSFDVQKGEIVSLIGPNGAGKSTAFNVINGTLEPTAGTIIFDGVNITGKRPSAVVQCGLVRTFQSAAIFTNATVYDNVFRGAIAKLNIRLWQQLWVSQSYLKALNVINQEIDQILEITGLAHYRNQRANELAYGHQKRLGVAIGLATKPKLLLLDEPAAGLNHNECVEFGKFLKQLRDEYHITLLFVEHHMSLVMDVSDRIIVLVQGEKIASGTPAQIASNPQVIDAYLGEFHEDA